MAAPSHALALDGVGAGDDDEIFIASRAKGCFEFAEHVFHRDDDRAREVGATFGVFLIFHKESREARVFHGADCVRGLERAAVAGVGVGKDGNGDGGGDAAGLAYDVLTGQQADVR